MWTGFSQDRYWYVLLSSGHTLSEMSLESFSRNSLYVRDSTRQHSVYIDSIVKLWHLKGGGYWSGAQVGAGVGAIVGALIGGVAGAEYSKPSGGPLFIEPQVQKTRAAIAVGIVGGIGGGVLGLIAGSAIGAATSFDEEFDFSSTNHIGKLNILYQLLQRHPQNN